MHSDSPLINKMSLSPEEALRQLDLIKDKSELGSNNSSVVVEQPGKTIADKLTDEIQKMILSVLKLDSKDFSATTPLMDYGLDSIAATEIGTLFTNDFNIVIPPTVFFEFQDLQSFITYLLENHKTEIQERYVNEIEESSPELPVKNKESVIKVASFEGGSANDAGDSADETELLSIESLWKQSESETNTIASPDAVPNSELLTFSSNNKTEVRQPAKEVMQSMQAYVDQALVHNITRKNTHNLEYVTYGNGEPVLVLGGLLMHYSAMWLVNIKELGKHYRLIMFHMPGCGNLELYENLSLDSLAKDISDVLDSQGITKPLPVVGCSFGGVLAQAFTIAYPERCSALSVTVTTPFAEGASDFQLLMKELQTSSRFMEINRGWPMASLPAYQQVIEGFDFREALEKLDMPALVIAGAKDKYTTPAYSKMITEKLSGAEYIEFSDAGHLLPFTHYEDYNAAVLEFLDSVTPIEKQPDIKEGKVSSFLPAKQNTLELVEDYIALGNQGHCVILSAPSAQLSFLLNIFCNKNKTQWEDYTSYFVTSAEEAFDAAIRLARHHARNKKPKSEGKVIIIDEKDRWLNYFDPLNKGEANSLVPNILFVKDIKHAESLLSTDDICAVAWVSSHSENTSEVERFLSLLKSHNALSILLENNSLEKNVSEWTSYSINQHPDIVVFGENISGSQAPIGACLINKNIANPWIMTPNEGYIRQPMASFGLTVKLAYEYLVDQLNPIISSENHKLLRQIEADPEVSYETHLRYGNTGYAKVARMHGYDARFYEGRGLRSRIVRKNETSREIIDCLSNVGNSPRGLNPQDIIDDVLHTHDSRDDYWFKLGKFLSEKTGFDHTLPASSQTTVIESALTLALLAKPERNKVLCFTDGAGFSLLSAATSFDKVFDLFRKPFEPLYPDSVFIDPAKENAAELLEKELLSGEIGFVWFETIQVEGNAVRPLPAHLIELINKHKESGGYLIGVDETQTNISTGKLLHSEGIVDSPDIVAIATGLCDSLFPVGAVLANSNIIEKAQKTNPHRLKELQQRSACQLSAHIALNSLNKIYNDHLLDKVPQLGGYLQSSLKNLQKEFPLICDVRGEGLLLAVEFDLSAYGSFIQQSFGYLLWGAMLRDPEFGVALVVCPIHNQSLRFVVPLTATKNEIDIIVENLRRRVAGGVEQVISDCASYCIERGDPKTAEFLTSIITTN
jgi:acetylornithine/succinyldiaminopimelate/putrescine aminotransferase/pimeloyl-ACP methyl ester carboxylesterase/acyl carrier protein